MPETWENLVANWATDRGLCRTDAIVRLSGTPLWLEARERHLAGATELVVRMMLDSALAHTGMTPQPDEQKRTIMDTYNKALK